MKRVCLILALLMHTVWSAAQEGLPILHDSLFSTYYHQRKTLNEALPIQPRENIFLGNSITDGGEWPNFFPGYPTLNAGISGDISAGVLHRLPALVARKPAKIFLLIGINDLARGIKPDSVLQNIILLNRYLKLHSPATRLFVQSVLPVNGSFGKFAGHTFRRAEVIRLNEILKDASTKQGFTFIDLYSSFCDTNGRLQARFTNDGLHLTGEGYLHWLKNIYPYVTGLPQKPSLIPEPQSLQWETGYFILSQDMHIVVNDSMFMELAKSLHDSLAGRGWFSTVVSQSTPGKKTIILEKGKISGAPDQKEAYELQVRDEVIRIRAAGEAGMIYALQTLRQLMRNGFSVDACRIIDWPAFPWRGYMVDVGRNYQSMELLREQIDRMAAYKLNVFHFHATEDIAWRLQIRQYPQLTRPEHMLRDKGCYYTQDEIRELAAYCRERHIEFVPEIDMPGHSAAFTRAMGVGMQSDSGLNYVKEILKEWCETFDFPYIHIGADEVKITRADFIPEVSKLLKSYGKQVIGWEPGGNFSADVIRQLWMDDLARISSDDDIRYIDSRHLYLNHMDPLETVVTLFNRQMASRDKADRQAWGATLCVWPDRALAQERDMLRMNAVYPGMLSFAERIWRGGGQPGWIAHIDHGDSAAFREFEVRLMSHRQQYFQQVEFPYQAQADISWQLIGPFHNKGDLAESFWPEKDSQRLRNLKEGQSITGGTIILRHWWANLIKGALEQPGENSTWYAYRRVWSDRDTLRHAWIGFNDLSRSPATDSPPPGAWDAKQSAVWINGQLLPPPIWKRPGQKGDSEIPLIDQGYSYRQPSMVKLRRGWNDILIKAPVGSFKGKDWQNPVKWMFTFVIVN